MGSLGADLSGLCGNGPADGVGRIHEGEARRRADRALVNPRDDVPLDFVEVDHHNPRMRVIRAQCSHLVRWRSRRRSSVALAAFMPS